MAHYDCSCCGESMGVSHDYCPECKAGRCSKGVAPMTNPKHPPADMAGLDGLIERLLVAFMDEVDTWDNIDHLKGSIKRKGVQAMRAAVATQLQALAARVKVLEAENERLREALQSVTPAPYFGESEQNKAWWAKARAALKGTEQ